MPPAPRKEEGRTEPMWTSSSSSSFLLVGDNEGTGHQQRVVQAGSEHSKPTSISPGTHKATSLHEQLPALCQHSLTALGLWLLCTWISLPVYIHLIIKIQVLSVYLVLKEIGIVQKEFWRYLAAVLYAEKPDSF